MPSGGYRKPNNPAPVSGPGRLSRRTDGGPMDKQPVRAMPSDGQYGARKASVDAQSAAPMAAAQPAAQGPALAGIFDPTARPNEPITAGNVLGAGPGPEALKLPNSAPSLTSTLRRLSGVDTTGEVDYVLNMLNERGIS